jgi:hypothetical protein
MDIYHSITYISTNDEYIKKILNADRETLSKQFKELKQKFDEL